NRRWKPLKQFTPCPRIAPQIHHSSNENFIKPNLIKESEWEAVSSTAPASRRHRMPGVRKSQDSIDRSVNLPEKGCAKPALLLFVVKGCFC
ncbi:MAG: hypothetical protein WAM70_01850, partial [Pyrinomonadaceae bacterium]